MARILTASGKPPPAGPESHLPMPVPSRYDAPMDVDTVIATLRAHRGELASLGIAHAALFGSLARGEADADSDIDIVIDFAPGRVPDIYTFVGLQQRIAELFPIRVDVVDEGGLRPHMRAAIERDLIRAF